MTLAEDRSKDAILRVSQIKIEVDMKKKKGVPVGYKIKGWTYRGRWQERKTGKKRWKFRFDATKRRKAKSYGSHPKGRKISWSIRARQDVIKTGKGQYQTRMYGTKKLIKSK